jgi:hypothetical protein
MKSSSLACKDQLRRHFGAAFVIVTLLAAVCGSANAQPVAVNVTVLPSSTPPPPRPAACGPPASGQMICVDREPISTPSVSPGTDVAIVWNVTTSGWSFVKNKGIDIKDKKDWKVKEGDSDTQYTATNKKENGAPVYTYKINLMKGSTNLSWDPTIMN